jgi:hypothetical protein
MEGHHGLVTSIDGRLDFLADEISEQMMHELARTWTSFKMGYPTSSKLAALAETIYLQWAVAALATESMRAPSSSVWTNSTTMEGLFAR